MKRPGPYRLLSPQLRALFDMISAATETGAPCPSNVDLARTCGYSAATGPAKAIKRLIAAGLISVEHITNGRTITVCATGKSAVTAPQGKPAPIVPDSIRTVRKDSQGITAAIRQRATLNAIQRHEFEATLPRVDRDPCPRCQVRRDIGCAHSASRLTTSAYA